MGNAEVVSSDILHSEKVVGLILWPFVAGPQTICQTGNKMRSFYKASWLQRNNNDLD